MAVSIAGRYELGELIGVGGNARVYAATDQVLHRRVAVKLVSAEEVRLRDPSGRDRFIREARTSAEFLHPNAVTVFDAGEHDGVLYLVMELVDGETLAARIARGRLDAIAATRIAADVLAALDAAHRRGVVHRDVKPANILVQRDGRAKLTDFGIAKRLDPVVDGLTAHGRIFGTPKYLAPEQVAGTPVSPATDVYAVGVVLYEMLAGRPPFDAPDDIATALAHRDLAPPDLAALRPDLPPALVAVVARALRKNPAHRFTSAASMLDSLRAAASSAPAVSVPADTATARPAAAAPTRRFARELVAADRRGRRALAFVAAVVAALVVAGAVFVATRPSEAARSETATTAPAPSPTTVTPLVPTTSATVPPTTTTPSTTVPATVPPPVTNAPVTTPVATTLALPTDPATLIAYVGATPTLAGARHAELTEALEDIDHRKGKKRRDAIEHLLEDIDEWIADGEVDPALSTLVADALGVDEEDDD